MWDHNSACTSICVERGSLEEQLHSNRVKLQYCELVQPAEDDYTVLL